MFDVLKRSKTQALLQKLFFQLWKASSLRIGALYWIKEPSKARRKEQARQAKQTRQAKQKDKQGQAKEGRKASKVERGKARQQAKDERKLCKATCLGQPLAASQQDYLYLSVIVTLTYENYYYSSLLMYLYVPMFSSSRTSRPCQESVVSLENHGL